MIKLEYQILIDDGLVIADGVADSENDGIADNAEAVVYLYNRITDAIRDFPVGKASYGRLSARFALTRTDAEGGVYVSDGTLRIGVENDG